VPILQEMTGRRVIVKMAAHSDILAAIGNSYRALDAIDSRIQEFEVRDLLRRDAIGAGPAQANDDAPVVQVVHLIITQALRDRASDVHIEPRADRVRVRYRIDGACTTCWTYPGRWARWW
jgi:type IV pilus assembly protein PilB